ncbi:MAG: hypothetical protein E7396_04775 [Ruminococcaceae bacterium]|nr:hypothetical protein [Oscillospiraceae bacterium]
MDKNKPLFKIVIFIIVVIVMGLFLKSYLSDGKEYSVDTSYESTEGALSSDREQCMVDISGEVNNPGVYSVKMGIIVDQAIMAAGGYTQSADIEAINRAERVYDGMKIVVPKADDDTYMDIYKGILNN